MPDLTPSCPAVSAAYHDPVKLAVVFQLIVGVLCSILLDGGQLWRTTFAVALAFWTGVAVVMIRRPFDPSPSDLWFVRWAFLPLWLLAVVVSGWWFD